MAVTTSDKIRAIVWFSDSHEAPEIRSVRPLILRWSTICYILIVAPAVFALAAEERSKPVNSIAVLVVGSLVGLVLVRAAAVWASLSFSEGSAKRSAKGWRVTGSCWGLFALFYSIIGYALTRDSFYLYGVASCLVMVATVWAFRTDAALFAGFGSLLIAIAMCALVAMTQDTRALLPIVVCALLGGALLVSAVHTAPAPPREIP